MMTEKVEHSPAGRRQAPPSGVDSRAPSIQLPRGGGAARGIGEKFTAAAVTGTGSMSVPIASSPGRSGFGPQLSLAYDSGAGNGPFGFGWSLSIPSITRQTDKGLPRYDDAAESDVFLLSGAEDLVPVLVQDAQGEWVRDRQPARTVAGGTYQVDRYRPRVEGLFARIERWTNTADRTDVFWRVISRDGITSWYGRTAESRVADPGDPRRVFSWLLCQSHDDKGNVVVYGYKPEDSARIFENASGDPLTKAHERNRTKASRSAQRYLKHVRYGNQTPYYPVLDDEATWPEPAEAAAPDASDAWRFELVFDYGEHDADAPAPTDAGAWPVRPDPFSSCRAAFEVRTMRLCRRVLMFHHFPGESGVDRHCLVRSTDLTYTDEVDPTDARSPVYTFLSSVSQAGYRRQDGGYHRRALPPVEFEYTRPVVRDTVEEIDPSSLDNLPIGLDGGTYRFTDLHGEGIPGILTEQAGAWYYKRNLSPIPQRSPGGADAVRARFGALETVAAKPAATLSAGAAFMDLAGDGRPDVVTLDGPLAGAYEHGEAEDWQPFRAFSSMPVRDLRDPNLTFVDLDGDGRADLLITEDGALIWHASLGEDGFGPAHRLAQSLDEETGPRVVLADGTGSVHLADLSGDGLADIVRIRNGDVCYWPNLGYGRFGAKVTMDNAPWLDHPDHFDQRRVRLADIDGSGTTDIIYLHRDGVRLYFNQSGNSWSRPHWLAAFPRVDDMASIVTADLLGDGTTCLVWSSSLPADARRPLRYVNLMGRRKPHLMTRMTNNLGAETRVDYAPSTKFYLTDKRAGTPWITRLPFPVHVVERVETYDHIGRNRFVTRYAYHHGHFDGEEREFRGFGMVEQWDTEELAALADGGPPAENVAAASHVPAVHTKTWFHTGVHIGRGRVSDYFAGLLTATDTGEYFREPGLTDAEAGELLLPDTVLPDGLSHDEEREACRALNGSMLRQEVYADDAGPGAAPERILRARTPYTVTEQNFTVRTVQPRGGNRHAVFQAHAREAIGYHYERDPADPRVHHALTLDVDDYGNVLKEASIGYGRRTLVRTVDAAGQVRLVPNPGLAELAASDRAKQTTPLLTYAESRFTDPVETPDAHRNPLACERRTFELTGYTATGPGGRYRAADLVEADPDRPGRLRHRFTAPEVPYEAVAVGDQRRRPIEWSRTVYRRDDLTGLLPLGDLEPLALPGESYELAFTPGVLAQVFRRLHQEQPAEPLLPDPPAVLGGAGGYLRSQTLKADGRFPASDADDHWWLPSGRSFYSPDPADGGAAELAHARAHFFTPRRYRDPFGVDSFVDFDAHDMLMAESRDALGNRVTAEVNDYRVLQPRLLSDANRNRTEVAFDTLGMVVGTAVMGKPAPAAAEGDTLEGFRTDLTPAELDGLFDAADPDTAAAALLEGATARTVYDLDRFRRTRQAHPDDSTKWRPVCAATIARETHATAPLPPQGLRIDLSFTYSDGFGREIQKKIQAEPGPLVEGGPTIDPRWVGTGWTIFNNKGKPVRQYEPFFSATQAFEFGVTVGVSPVLFYDPAERVIATLHPNHTYDKVVFDPWRQNTYDVNDTCAARAAQTGDPRTDPDVGGYVAAYFATQPAGWQTWHAQRASGALGVEERNAALRASAHADTPTTAHFDTLGRPFLTIARNRVVCPGHDLDGSEDSVATRVELDIEGNQRAVRDAALQAGDPLGRVVARYAYDLLGNRVQQVSMEAGTRWVLHNVSGQPIRAWDSRGHNFTTAYDRLGRPVAQTIRGTTPDSDPRTLDRDILIEKLEYGEALANAEALNLRTRVYRHFDSAGVTTNARLDAGGNPTVAYDFKGNLLRSTRRLVRDYRAVADWLLEPPLEAETFEGGTRYDALNRPVQSIVPHSSLARAKYHVIQPVFNEANLLERMDVWLERTAEPGALLDPGVEAPAPVGVASVEYDAKGQRLRLEYKNGAVTRYRYDPDTFRLVHLYARRGAAFTADCDNPAPPPPTIAAPDRPPQGRACGLQNLHYTYDPAGNVTHLREDGQQAIFFRNRRVEPSNDYTYDALYRLIQATGREHLGQHGAPVAHSHGDAGRVGLLSADAAGRFAPNDGNAMGAYVERYVYDAAGNFLRTQHRGTDPAQAGWTRAYSYLEPSLIEDGTGGTTSKTSNRLTDATLHQNGANPLTQPHAHDVHGNIVRMPHLGAGAAEPNMHWDYKDRLRQADLGGGGTAHYVYDASGERVRKVWEKAPGLTEERIYLGGFEIFRRHNVAVDPATVTLERETLHVVDDRQLVALVETRTLDTVGDPAPRQLIRYQLGNHLGSVALELDDQAQIISYEEYSPYGSSTYQAVRSQTETAKRHRYTGKERDEETGFYYHGARYYAAWIGRWISADPLLILDGLNLYRYAQCNPVRLSDPSGNAGEDFSDLAPLVDELNHSELKVDLVDKRTHAKPATPMGKKAARKYGNKQARDYRVATGMKQGATVQAGHTAAARHAPQSGISKQDWDTQQMQELHSRKGQGLDVDVTDHAKKTTTTTRHRSQEGLIDDAVERAKAANGGKLTPQGQLDAAAEVKWRTENVPMDQRDVEALRKSGPAAPEKGPAVDPKTGKVVSKEAKLVKAGEKAGEKAVSKSSKALKVATKLGKAGRHFAAAIPVAGIVLGQASAAHAASQGDYQGAALDEIGFVPVAGDLLDAFRGGVALGQAADEALGISDVAAGHGEKFERAAKSVGLGEDASRIVGATGAALSAITVAPSIALQNTVMGWFR